MGQVFTFSRVRWWNIIQVRMYILIRHHFLVHIKGIHKCCIHNCMSKGCTGHHLACMYCATPGLYRNRGKCLHLLVWGSGVLCKLECYTGVECTCTVRETLTPVNLMHLIDEFTTIDKSLRCHKDTLFRGCFLL